MKPEYSTQSMPGRRHRDNEVRSGQQDQEWKETGRIAVKRAFAAAIRSGRPLGQNGPERKEGRGSTDSRWWSGSRPRQQRSSSRWKTHAGGRGQRSGKGHDG